MSKVAAKLREKFKKLYALFVGTDKPHERDVAYHKLNVLLAKHGLVWVDLLGIVSTDDPQIDTGVECIDDGAPLPNISALDLIHHLLRRYLHLAPDEYVAVALWILQTHVFDRFLITPRLAFCSPVRECGKTTALSITFKLAAKPVRIDHITPAASFRMVDRKRPTMLLDEIDNADLPNNAMMRVVLNSGHRRGGQVTRYIDGEATSFSTFAPVALAVIGRLPFPLMSRSIVINMERAPRTVTITKFDELDSDIMHDCDITYRTIVRWARDCKLNLAPPMPAQLSNRCADNWRVLLSIADSFRPTWGERARQAAIALSKHRDEDCGLILLSDIRDIFDRRAPIDRLASEVLVNELCDAPDSLWSDWRGIRDDQQPRLLTQGELARLLRAFHIRSKTIWPARRGRDDKSSKGYFRNQFEAAWASYCNGAGTAAQPSNVRYLREGGG